MQKEPILLYLKQLKSELLQRGIEKIGLFGSFAQDSADTFSDIDIAIKIEKDYLNKHDVWEYFNLIQMIKEKLYLKFSRQVDVFDLDSESNIKDYISKKILYV